MPSVLILWIFKHAEGVCFKSGDVGRLNFENVLVYCSVKDYTLLIFLTDRSILKGNLNLVSLIRRHGRAIKGSAITFFVDSPAEVSLLIFMIVSVALNSLTESLLKTLNVFIILD